MLNLTWSYSYSLTTQLNDHPEQQPPRGREDRQPGEGEARALGEAQARDGERREDEEEQQRRLSRKGELTL